MPLFNKSPIQEPMKNLATFISTATLLTALAIPVPANAQPAQSKQELLDRAWFVGMAAGLVCLAKKGEIKTSERFKQLVLYNMKRRNKEYLKPWSLTKKADQAVKISASYLSYDCTVDKNKARKSTAAIIPYIK